MVMTMALPVVTIASMQECARKADKQTKKTEPIVVFVVVVVFVGGHDKQAS